MVKVLGSLQQVLHALLPGDPPHEGDDGTLLVDAQLIQHRRLTRLPYLGIDAVEDHVDLVGVDAGVCIQD